MGSGIAIKRAISKYGVENFEKKILKLFSSMNEAYAYEKEFVNEDLVKNSQIYNMTIGGRGGFSHIDVRGKNNPMYGKSELMKEIQSRPEVIAKRSKTARATWKKKYEDGYQNPHKGKHNYWENEEKAAQARDRMSGPRPSIVGDKNPFYGKKHTPETVAKLSNIHKNRKKVQCPHCQKIGDISNMTRWHLDNCKHKET